MCDKEITGQLSDPKSTQIKLMIDISNRRAYDKFTWMNEWINEIIEKKKWNWHQNRHHKKTEVGASGSWLPKRMAVAAWEGDCTPSPPRPLCKWRMASLCRAQLGRVPWGGRQVVNTLMAVPQILLHTSRREGIWEG